LGEKMAKLQIEIETEDEKGLYSLLDHVYKEITDKNYYNYDIEYSCQPYEDWLVINDKGRYKWSKI
jgi:hypothetical protein